jgi:hypothetical protein
MDNPYLLRTRNSCFYAGLFFVGLDVSVEEVTKVRNLRIVIERGVRDRNSFTGALQWLHPCS